MKHALGTRRAFYASALKNLGPFGTVRRAIQKTLGTDPMELTSRHLENPVWARQHSTDLDVFDMVFTEHEYACLDHVTDVKIIIDAGANVGFSSAYFLEKFPKSRVVAIEPDTRNFEMLKRNLAAYGNRVVYLHAGLWSHNTTLKISESSASPGNDWGRQTEEGGTIAAYDINTLLRDHGIDEVDIFKMDIEGAERPIFANGGLEWVTKTRNMAVELHDDACSSAAFEAMKDFKFKQETSGELTLFLDIAKQD